MKNEFLEYLKNELAGKQLLLTQNSLSEDDRALLDGQVEGLNAMIQRVDDMEEVDTQVVEDLKKAVSEMAEKIQAIGERLAQSQQQNEEENMENNYLQTTNAVHDFCECIRNTKDPKKFNQAWGEYLSQNSVTFETGAETHYLPEIVKGRIQDAWEKSPILSKLNKVNAKQYAIRWSDDTQDNLLAKGHKKGEAKTDQTRTLNAKTLVCKAVYVLLKLDNETIFMSDEDLVNYLLNSCLTEWTYTVTKAAIVGDGRSEATPDLRITGIKPIVRASTDSFVTVGTRNTTTYPFLKEQLVAMTESIKITDGVNDTVLLISRTKANELRKVVASSTSTPVYLPLDQVASEIGIAEVIPVDWLGSNIEAVMFRPSGYTMIGGLEPRLVSQEDITYNTTTWRYENFLAGDVEKLKSAYVLKAASVTE